MFAGAKAVGTEFDHCFDRLDTHLSDNSSVKQEDQVEVLD